MSSTIKCHINQQTFRLPKCLDKQLYPYTVAKNSKVTLDCRYSTHVLLNMSCLLHNIIHHVPSSIKHYKAKNPEVIIGVGGCVASQEGENIINRAPYVDLVFGPQTLHRLPDMISNKVKTDLDY